MGANPEPEDTVFHLDGQRPVMNAYSHGPEGAGSLEVQRRVIRIRLQQHEGSVRDGLNTGRKGFVRTPEVWSGVVDHRSEERPDS